MNKITILLLTFILCMPAGLMAQEEDDSRYLAGAVPEENGKVVFSKTFNVAGMSKQEIMQRTQAWMDGLLKSYQNTSRILLTDEENGNVVGNADHYLVFSSSGLSLDRARLQFMLTATVQPENLTLMLNRIRYVYNDTGKETTYPAEEMISDDFALNKARTKLVRGVAKFRRKTVDYVDSLFLSAIDMLKANASDRNRQAANSTAQDTIVIHPDNAAREAAAEPKTMPLPPGAVRVMEVPSQQGQAAGGSNNQSGQPAEGPSPTTEDLVSSLSADKVNAGNGRLVIVIGEDIYDRTTLTARAGGTVGRLQGKPVVYTFLNADQDASAIDKADTYSVHFYPTEAGSAPLIMECRKAPAPKAAEGMPQLYIGEILKVTTGN